MNIYLNGCSHMCGDSCKGNELSSFGNIIGSSILGINNYTTIIYNMEKSVNSINDSVYDEYFYKIQDNNNYLFFHSHHGKSNDKIFYESVTTLYESIKFNKKIDLSVIQWSGPNRRFHTLVSNQKDSTNVVNVNAHDFTNFGLKFEPFASNQTLQYMLILQDLYKKHNVEYVFVPYMELDSESLELSNIESMIDESRLTCNLREGHRNEIRTKGLSADFHGHPNIIGHYYIASKILDVLGIGDSLIGFFDYFKNTFNDFSMNDVYFKDDYKLIKKNGHSLGDGSESIIKEILKRII